MRMNQRMLLFSLQAALGMFHSTPAKNPELFRSCETFPYDEETGLGGNKKQISGEIDTSMNGIE